MRQNAAKTHCPSGHEYTPENTIRNPQGHRACRVCTTRHKRAYDRRREYDQCPGCAGLKNRNAPRCRRCADEARKAHTRAALIAAIRAWAQEHGQPPAANEWGPAGVRPTVTAARYVFGSWSNAIAAAGLDPTQRHRERTWPHQRAHVGA